MTLKKINPEELIAGKKYLLEMEYSGNDGSAYSPLTFKEGNMDRRWFGYDQPIYTHEDTSELPWWLLLKKGDKFMYLDNVKTFNGIIKKKGGRIGIGSEEHPFEFYIDACRPYVDHMQDFMNSLTPEQAEAVEKYKQLTEQK